MLRVVAVPRLTLPPNAPPALAGLLDDGGELVCVLHFRSLAGATVPDNPGLYEHVILLRGADPRWALLVDRVEALAVPEIDALKPVPSGISLRDHIASEIGTEDGPAAMIDPARLVSEFERDCIAHFVKEERRRREAFAGAEE